ncbi:MAG TPA: serine/threonine-protein kinase [Polyangiaceae bacterium]|jgi:serine/threonine-protein kinase
MTNPPNTIPPASMPFPPGSVLAGKYRVERLLGEGGMGWVVVATHLQLEQRVALKFMREAHAAEQPDAVARFLREARAAARIQSEHVARVSDVGTLDSGIPYLVMEYLEGQDLEALLHSRRHVPLQMAVDYALQACEGLAEAHAVGIVHRDLKPANLFLARRSDGSIRVKLLDFGISKLVQTSGLPDVGMTSTQALMGSPLYMSPEQLRSSKNVDRRADIWSMGVILYELFGGRSPFEADTLPEVCSRIMAVPPEPLGSFRPELPPALDAVVQRCLEKDPQRRFPDVASLAQALAPFGPAEARTAVERIARLGRGPAFSATEMAQSPGDSAPAMRVAAAIPGVAQTNASFSTVGPAIPGKRSPAVLALAAGAGLVVAAAIVIAVVAMRGKPEVAPAASSPTMQGNPVPSALAPLVAPSTAPPPASASAPAVTGTETSALAPPAPSPPTATTQPVATTPRFQQPHPRPTSTGPATAAPTAKPASTTGFGGRN